MRELDEFDYEAERLFDLVRDAKPDQEVIDTIAEALRQRANRTGPSNNEGRDGTKPQDL